MMEVNAQVREGAKCKRGDVVSVVMELDEDTRAVDVPALSEEDDRRRPRSSRVLTQGDVHAPVGICARNRVREKARDKGIRIAAMMDVLRNHRRKKIITGDSTELRSRPLTLSCRGR